MDNTLVALLSSALTLLVYEILSLLLSDTPRNAIVRNKKDDSPQEQDPQGQDPSNTDGTADIQPYPITPNAQRGPVPYWESNAPTPWRAIRLGLGKLSQHPRGRRLRDNAPDGARRFYDVLFASTFLRDFDTKGKYSHESLLECAYAKMGPKGYDYVIRKGFDCGLAKDEHDMLIGKIMAKRDQCIGKKETVKKP